MGFKLSRYGSRIHKEFEVEVVTPMFLGGANVTRAELRVPSLKGMLRFWWRATSGINDLGAMKKREGELFGDTSRKALFSVSIENFEDTDPVLANLPKGKSFEVRSRRRTFYLGIIDYLAYGLRDHKNGYHRQHFPAGTRFGVRFTFSRTADADEILRAFYTLVHFGGLGAKTRNGFGCIRISNPPKPAIAFGGPLGVFSAASEASKLFITPRTDYGRWEDALSAVGMAYKDARLDLDPRHFYGNRSLLAKPIVQDPNANPNERHAKPYYLHVGCLGNKRYYGQILHMPYRYMAGRPEYSDTVLERYQIACRKMDQKIKQLLAGGSK
ncbi:type III-B CRISPR module RAMP protein Cmr1 [Desulfococcus multivorans]|uniref:CRISPR-associated protein TM1795 family protein n=1 Tax=Desulfococcus multivorans DSM 2059 TaxID=1121405 RepID=S7T9L5_DESML|nr:type III-B CRISPR module RAMP protein Cmr1 [Desulfococcus multivorans]AOY59358.1 Cas1: CRISPR-associated protein Cas1 [Desulfococcus multivorans]EPR33311.1 CRISPR-associated protein TM1795 family protein [Desulfococcus multivorans DSM 2059]SKA13891.1 CRISPR-associated protein Cmr1 [Desulfococcus multivorans DSM 2059]